MLPCRLQVMKVVRARRPTRASASTGRRNRRRRRWVPAECYKCLWVTLSVLTCQGVPAVSPIVRTAAQQGVCKSVAYVFHDASMHNAPVTAARNRNSNSSSTDEVRWVNGNPLRLTAVAVTMLVLGPCCLRLQKMGWKHWSSRHFS